MLRGYVIEALLGEGSAARVYRGRCPITDEVVAIKLIASGAKPERAERLRREEQALDRIHHPNVVRVHEFGITTDGSAYLIMELVPGITLGQLIRERAPLSPRTFWELARQLAEGLQAAHEAGVIHRDLKPSNVLVAGSGSAAVVRLVDFGLVRALSGERRLTENQVLLGTPLYMAPEQLLNPRGATQSSDLYALGAVYYEMLTGRTPFSGTLMDVLEQHQAQRPRPLNPSTVFDPLVYALLEKSPADRPASAAAVVEALDAIWERAGGLRAASAVSFAADAEPTVSAVRTEPRTVVDQETQASLLGTLDLPRPAPLATRILVEEDFVRPELEEELPTDDLPSSPEIQVTWQQPDHPMRRAQAAVTTALFLILAALAVALGVALFDSYSSTSSAAWISSSSSSSPS